MPVPERHPYVINSWGSLLAGRQCNSTDSQVFIVFTPNEPGNGHSSAIDDVGEKVVAEEEVCV